MWFRVTSLVKITPAGDGRAAPTAWFAGEAIDGQAPETFAPMHPFVKAAGDLWTFQIREDLAYVVPTEDRPPAV